MELERILCAAIHYDDGKNYKYQPDNIASGYVLCGRRHHNIISIHYELTGKRTMNKEQGFITSDNRFVDRIEALDIAKKAGQIINEIGSQLYSEDLY